MESQRPFVRLRLSPPQPRQDNRSWCDFAGALYQERQKAVLHASQGNFLAVEHHQLVAQMHEQVVITIELFVQGQHKHYTPQTYAILQCTALKLTPDSTGARNRGPIPNSQNRRMAVRVWIGEFLTLSGFGRWWQGKSCNAG